MKCPKCSGIVLSDADEYYCLQCGWHPVVNPLPPGRKPRVMQSFDPQFKIALVEEYLDETEGPAEKVRQLSQGQKEFRQMLECLWLQKGLAQHLTLGHLAVVECLSVLGVRTTEKIKKLGTFKHLNHYPLDVVIERRFKKSTGGHPYSSHTIELGLKMVICVSYQWLRSREVEREMALVPAGDIDKARSTAYTSIKNAYLLSRRILNTCGPDVVLLHDILTRVLWEDTYSPIVITEKGFIVDITY